ncbi:MAG TPA: hypothetical protein VMU76_02420 [Acidimicrobiales bacterium]|nr:hypothetical protein [Acidimicrobiales bacterium]
MALPDGCEVTPTHLVFWELASEPQLADTDKLYEFCCTAACTNAFRPLGPVEVVRHPYPDLGDGEVLLWGDRQLTAEAGRTYMASGHVLCELRLPVQPMGAPVPPGVSVGRPAGR